MKETLEDFKPKQRVIYVPFHANGDRNHPDVEFGMVSSVGETYVFVKFDKYVNKFGWEGTTSQACYPVNLLIDEKQ